MAGKRIILGIILFLLVISAIACGFTLRLNHMLSEQQKTIEDLQNETRNLQLQLDEYQTTYNFLLKAIEEVDNPQTIEYISYNSVTPELLIDGKPCPIDGKIKLDKVNFQIDLIKRWHGILPGKYTSQAELYLSDQIRFLSLEPYKVDERDGGNVSAIKYFFAISENTINPITLQLSDQLKQRLKLSTNIIEISF